MSAGIKAAAAARTEQPSSTAVLTTTQADDIMAAVAATLKDGNADIDSTTAESFNDTDEELNSFRFLTSSHTQQSEQQHQPQYLQSQGSSSSSTTLSPSSDVNSTVNVPCSPTAAGQQHEYDSRTHQEREDDDERVAAEYGDSLSQQNSSTAAGSPNSMQQLSPGLSLLQAAAASSPPPHSYRHSRAYRHFKNPPQPHMCIRTTTENGEELFINVLSWTRIVIPQEPSDPIPLYGGMRVPPGSPRSPPIVFAVMANPEVLKDSGRHSKDPEERRAMVELMCDFVEAMNPGVKLVRNAVILKDRDISGELKDVWNAVQAQRDREREEQMLQQRQQQQQHYHNMSTNAATNGRAGAGFTNPAGALPTHQQQQMFSNTMLGEMSEGTPPRSRRLIMPESQTNERSTNNIGGEGDADTTASLSMLAEQLDNKMSIDDDQEKLGHDSNRQKNCMQLANNVLSNGNEPKDCQDSNVSGGGDGVGVMHNKNDLNNQLNANNCTAVERKMLANTHTNGCATQVSPNANDADTTTASTIASPIAAELQSQTANVAKAPPTTNTNTNNAPPTTTTPVVVVNPPTKKEKLGGFLPNGCIFPRFTKNNKHKDKDKEGKTKDKEKNALLSALKKSKDKKSQQSSGSSSGNVNQDDKQQQQQNELNNTKKTSAIHATATNTTPTTTTKTTPITSTTITANTTMQQQTSVTTLINNHHNNIHTTAAATVAVAKNSIQQLETEVQRLDLNHAEKTAISSSNTNPNAASSTNTTNSTTGVGVH